MSKVLKSSKPKAKKSIILSKAKKDADILKIISAQESSSASFEIDAVKKETIVEDPDIVRRNAHLEKMLRRQRRKEWDLVGRVLPSITDDRERERILSKIATRSVQICLFTIAFTCIDMMLPYCLYCLSLYDI
jgi:hypothetical protein